MVLAMKVFKILAHGLNAVLFPPACQCCGDVQVEDNRLLCPYCTEHLFEFANPERSDSCSEIILPEYIAFQDALWKYDKGGYLQDLLYKLKYHGMSTLGVQLGRLLGAQLLNNPAYHQQNEYILLPVPLHPARKRKRGYNQARSIATGISGYAGIPVIHERAVIRLKNTRSQTGYNLSKRIQNLKQAFRVDRPEALNGRIPVIVDDVFTTGTTAFELAAAVRPHTGHSMGIVTVALA